MTDTENEREGEIFRLGDDCIPTVVELGERRGGQESGCIGNGTKSHNVQLKIAFSFRMDTKLPLQSSPQFWRLSQ